MCSTTSFSTHDDDSPVLSPVADEGRAMCGLTELVSSCLTSGQRKKHSDDVSTSSSFSLSPLHHGMQPSSSFSSLQDVGCNGERRKKKNGATDTDAQPFFRCSLFSNVPPTIRFYTKGTKVSKPNRKLTSRLAWCQNSLLPVVMRQSLSTSHFKVVDETRYWMGYWGRHLKSADYKNIKPHQKVNHFPGAFHIGRKDRLWMHVAEQIDQFGADYEIVPRTYILPKEMDNLSQYLSDNPDAHVIVKPPASARGTGIIVTRKLKEIKQDTPLIAQQYIDRPMTLNGAKFDLRLYAYIPSLEPMRIYLYDEGLVRFASIPYSRCTSTVSNKYMHLTNYSINKLAEKDGVADSPVPKWKVTDLWDHFDRHGKDSKAIRHSIEDVIIKAFIACERHIREHMARQIHSGFVCHELFGVDILLDEWNRPWLLEVNISPSLHSGTPLDNEVKAPLAKDVLNLAGIYINNGPAESFRESHVYATRPRRWPKSTRQLEKERECECSYAGSGAPSSRVTQRLTPEDVRALVEFEDELERAGSFRLLFPTHETVAYMKYFSQPVYSNLLLQRWQIEQKGNRTSGVDRLEKLCKEGLVLQDDDDTESSDECDLEVEEADADEDSEEDMGEA